MAEHEFKQIISQLESLKGNQVNQAPQLLSRAKLGLLRLNALVPNEDSKPQHLKLAVTVLELGALISIRLKDTEAFTRYYQQLQPFYALPLHGQKERSNQSKVTGLYLLLLLSTGDYAGFHTVLEGLEVSGGKDQIERDEFIQYPLRLEQALMEGSYDKVWGETKRERVPSEEFGVFSEVSFPNDRHQSDSAIVLTTFCAGPYKHDPFRDCLMLGASISVLAHRQCEESSVPRFRRRGHPVCTVTRMGCKGRKNILPTTGRGSACG